MKIVYTIIRAKKEGGDVKDKNWMRSEMHRNSGI